MQLSKISSKPTGTSKLFKAADPADTVGPIVARLAFCVPALFLFVGLELERSWLYFPYFVSEWMVNYTGGFLRRGMLGEVMWLSGKALHVSPMTLIDIARFGVAIGLSAFFGNLVFQHRKALGWLGAVILLANPYFVFYLWCDTGALDVFFVFVTAAHFCIARREQGKYLWQSLIFFATAGVFVVLTHEAFLLFCLPVNILIARYKLGPARMPAIAAIFATPVVAGLVALMFHGTPNQAETIYHHWNLIGFNQPYKIGFEQIGLNLSTEVQRVWNDFSLAKLALWIVNVAFCSFPTLIVLGSLLKANPGEGKKVFVFTAIAFIAPLPLYIVGSDWDRWMSVSWLIAITCFLSSFHGEKATRIGTSTKVVTLGLVLLSLLVRPYAPFLPFHRFYAGPATRILQYLKGQVPT